MRSGGIVVGVAPTDVGGKRRVIQGDALVQPPRVPQVVRSRPADSGRHPRFVEATQPRNDPPRCSVPWVTLRRAVFYAVGTGSHRRSPRRLSRNSNRPVSILSVSECFLIDRLLHDGTQCPEARYGLVRPALICRRRYVVPLDFRALLGCSTVGPTLRVLVVREKARMGGGGAFGPLGGLLAVFSRIHRCKVLQSVRICDQNTIQKGLKRNIHGDAEEDVWR
jgi:hypothetical protein